MVRALSSSAWPCTAPSIPHPLPSAAPGAQVGGRGTFHHFHRPGPASESSIPPSNASSSRSPCCPPRSGQACVGAHAPAPAPIAHYSGSPDRHQRSHPDDLSVAVTVRCTPQVLSAAVASRGEGGRERRESGGRGDPTEGVDGGAGGQGPRGSRPGRPSRQLRPRSRPVTSRRAAPRAPETPAHLQWLITVSWSLGFRPLLTKRVLSCYRAPRLFSEWNPLLVVC